MTMCLAVPLRLMEIHDKEGIAKAEIGRAHV